MKKNKIYIIFVIFFLAMAGTFLFFSNFKIVSIGKEKFITELALTNKERSVGLGKRDSLCQNCAMLFIFEKNGRQAFWMKDMKFDLDIIWIAGDEISHIEKNVSYKSSQIINPKISADKVLEINAGLSDRFGFAVGDKVNFFGL